MKGILFILLTFFILQSNQRSVFRKQPYTVPTTMKCVDDLITLKNIQREIDGSKNNLDNPDWGSFFTPYQRMRNYNTYMDGVQYIRDDLASPRLISNVVGTQQGTPTPSKLGHSLILIIWAQLVDHQITYTKDQVDDGEEKYELEGQDTTIWHYKMPIPVGDPHFDPDFTGQATMDFKRSIAEMTKGVRNQINQNTAWIDGRAIYGKTPQIEDSLRTYKNGKLKTSNQNLLARDEQGRLISGDDRVGENIALTSLVTVFVREHNRLCDIIIAKNPKLTDQEVFKAARNYVIGLMQKITYDDYLTKLMGKNSFNKYIGQYKGYNPTVSPNIYNQFSTGAYRIGHSLLVDNFPQINANNQIIANYKLSQLFHRDDFITSSIQVDNILRGVIQTPSKDKNCWMVDSLRDFLVTEGDKQDFKVDLFTYNLQRGREHGLPTYNQCRDMWGLKPYNYFEQITPQFADDLRSVHQNIWDVELFTGIVCEKPLANSVVGSLGAVMIGSGFKGIRDGDRFWYEYAYPKSVVQEIKSTTLSDIIMRNTGIRNLPKDIFILQKY